MSDSGAFALNVKLETEGHDMRTSEQQMADYRTYRGKCKGLVESAVAAEPTLTPVRGHYFCPFWGEQPHWWAVKPDGTIVDPSARQFPSNGSGSYEPFDGTVACAECGKEMQENEARFESNYAFCSIRCHMRFVGL